MRTPKCLIGTLLLAVAAFTSACGMGDMMPNPPSNLQVAELEGGAHLTWKDNSDNEASFMIERMVDSGTYQALATVPFDTTSYHDAPLVAGKTYMYRVMAAPKSGGHTADTKYSNEVTFKLAAP